MRFLSCLAIIVSAGLVSSTQSAERTNPQTLELIRTLVDRNQEALDKIASFRLEQEWKSVADEDFGDIPDAPPKGRRVTTMRTTYIVQGEKYRSFTDHVVEVPSANYKLVQRWQAALNDRYFVFAPSDETRQSIMLYEHSSIKNMRDHWRKLAEQQRPRNVFDYVSARYHSFSKRLDAPDTTWTVSTQADPPAHVVMSSHPTTGTAAYTFNDRYGYFITHITASRPDGKQYFEMVADIDKSDGIYYPKSITETTSKPDESAQHNIRVTNIEFREYFDESEFELDKIQFDPTKTVLRRIREFAGETERFVFRDNQWIPEELAQPAK